MAVTFFVSGAGIYNCMCLSSDVKPANPPDNCTLDESDTGKTYRAVSGAWAEVTNTSYPVRGQLPVIPSLVTQSQTIPDGCVALMLDGTTFSSGVSVVFQGTAQALFIKQLQIR